MARNCWTWRTWSREPARTFAQIGMVITQAAERCPAQLQALIYLAAYLPRDGQKLLDLADMVEGASTHIRPDRYGHHSGCRAVPRAAPGVDLSGRVSAA